MKLNLVLAMLVAAPAFAQKDTKLARRRGIRVVQKRMFTKSGYWELGFASGVVPNDAFITYVPASLRFARHFSERWAVELQAAYLLAFNSSLRTFLEEQDADLRARTRDKQQLRADLAGIWSPLYGKYALGQRRILHFDGYLLFGGGLVRTTVDPDDPKLSSAKIAPEGVFGVGIRTFVTKRWTLRFEYRQYLYIRPETTSGASAGLGLPSEVTLGVGLLLGDPS